MTDDGSRYACIWGVFLNYEVNEEEEEEVGLFLFIERDYEAAVHFFFFTHTLIMMESGGARKKRLAWIILALLEKRHINLTITFVCHTQFSLYNDASSIRYLSLFIIHATILTHPSSYP